MGYSDFENFTVAPFDGYGIKVSDGLVTFLSQWVDVHSFSMFSVHATFVGGAPTGTLKLQSSNQLQATGAGAAQPAQASSAGGVDDTKDVPSGNGTETVAVAAAGTVLLNQHFFADRWVRLSYTVTGSAANTSLSCFFNAKKG